MSHETRPVAAIKKGTVIDHIPHGQALPIVHLLSLMKQKFKIMIGINLESKNFKIKDLIKIENYLVTEDEANMIVVFAPEATINLIENFSVKQKITTCVPADIKAVFACPNRACITQCEAIESHFHIFQENKKIYLSCDYCEKTFLRDAVKVKNACSKS
jgi:aspartate carbamoyltransferase regulatory subunit